MVPYNLVLVKPVTADSTTTVVYSYILIITLIHIPTYFSTKGVENCMTFSAILYPADNKRCGQYALMTANNRLALYWDFLSTTFIWGRSFKSPFMCFVLISLPFRSVAAWFVLRLKLSNKKNSSWLLISGALIIVILNIHWKV